MRTEIKKKSKDLIIRALRKEFKKIHTVEEQLNAAFYTDYETENEYIWRYLLGNRYHKLIYSYDNNLISKIAYPHEKGKNDMNLTYLVFQAELAEVDGAQTGESFTFCCSNLRWMTLEYEMKDWLVVDDSINCIYETTDRNEARTLAEVEY